MASIELRRGQAGENRDRQLGPDAAHADELFEQRLFVLGEKAVERQGILAHVGMDAQPDLRARLRQVREGGDRDGYVIAHAAGFDDGLVGMFLDQQAAQQSDHMPVL